MMNLTGKGKGEAFALVGADYNAVGGGECRISVADVADDEVADHAFL